MLDRLFGGSGSGGEPSPEVADVSPRPSELRVPRLPPQQRLTEKWPVLHYQEPRPYDMARWEFGVGGLVDNEVRLSWDEFNALPRTEIVSDIHCVTHWSKFDNRWEGVHVRELLRLAGPKPEGQFVTVHADPRYTANVTLAELDQDDVLFATHHNGAPLAHEHGGPLRLVLPSLYFWKSAKWARGLEFRATEIPGFWERGGYHVRGDPWLNERFGGVVRETMQQARSRALRDGRRVAE